MSSVKKKPIRVATVYRKEHFRDFKPYAMSEIRWMRISEVLSRSGFAVDIILNNGKPHMSETQNPRFVRLEDVDWSDYDVIKTLFHKGFDLLEDTGGSDHPFIISKLGSVVGKDDNTEGVYFFRDYREQLYEAQRKIAERSRYITLLTEESIKLWEKEFQVSDRILHIPTGVDRVIPPPRRNPYRDFSENIAVYIGLIYSRETQMEVNRDWQQRLNNLGRLLKKRDIRLCLILKGDTHLIDPDAVTNLGAVKNDDIWDYKYFADVGIVLAQGQLQHNESSKIYYYLRAGLPVVSEAPVPNNHIIKDANLGYIVKYNDNVLFADRIEDAVRRKWDKKGAVDYILKHHTWDERAKVYEDLIKNNLE